MFKFQSVSPALRAVPLVLVMLFAAACQSTSPTTQSAAAPTQPALLMTGGHGGQSGTVMFLKSADPEHPTMLSTANAPTCERCKADAVNYFKTGKVDATCPECGAKRTVVEVMMPTIGHQ